MRDMKDSGIEWIGDVPQEWVLKKIKNAAEYISSGTTPASNNLDYYDGNVYWIQSGDIYGKSVVADTAVKVTELALKIPSLTFYVAPYIVMAMYGGSIGNTAISLIDACTNQACCCVKNDKKNDLHFMYYWLYICKDVFLFQAEGGGQPNISQSKIKNQYYVQPPLSEQEKIAAHLDRECSEIDALTADIKKQIETLEEYKRSVITEAVTKGLDPDVETKDSQVEWVGAIPAEWEMRKARYMFVQRFDKGNSLELQLLSPTQSYGVIPQWKYEELSGMVAVKLNEKADLMQLKTIHKGDYCISLRSFQGGFEYSKYEGVVSPAYQVFYPTVQIDDRYYKYMFKDRGFIEKMNSYTLTLRDGKNISFFDFGNTYIPYPPVEIQQTVADYLDRKCNEIENIIADKNKQLATLTEYKKSLIYEYVTGKKEV